MLLLLCSTINLLWLMWLSETKIVNLLLLVNVRNTFCIYLNRSFVFIYVEQRCKHSSSADFLVFENFFYQNFSFFLCFQPILAFNPNSCWFSLFFICGLSHPCWRQTANSQCMYFVYEKAYFPSQVSKMPSKYNITSKLMLCKPIL